MRALKFALVAILLIAVIGSAFLAYVLLAPVTASNVRFRLTSICALGTAAMRLDDAASAALDKLNKGSCGCLSGRLVDETGPETAAKVTEAARKLGMFGLKRKWNKDTGKKSENGGLLEASGIKDKIVLEFSERYVKAANACEAQAA